MKILLGVTGSVAATLTSSLCFHLQNEGITTRVALTEKALQFVNLQEDKEIIAGTTRHIQYLVATRAYLDKDEWYDRVDKQYERKAPILHIELRKWADAMLIAPLSANTLGKLANGLCDNLLTSIVRAWDNSKPIIVAPAMNTHMWEHPITQEQLSKLAHYFPKFSVVNPVHKVLACGDAGIGAMASIPDILTRVKQCVQ